MGYKHLKGSSLKHWAVSGILYLLIVLSVIAIYLGPWQIHSLIGSSLQVPLA